MKYVFLIPDGMADLPVPELDGKTPWQVAKTPNWDKLASKGLVGTVLTVPDGMYPGSDAANMSLLGYAPARYYTGRGPIEAVAMGVPLGERDAAYRCSLVTCDGETMIDYSSGHISTEEAKPLIELIGEKLGGGALKFYPGVGYRHIMTWAGGEVDVKTAPPHEIMGRKIEEYLPVGAGDDRLRQIMFDSLEILENHPINRRRRDEGLNPGSMLWLWSPGHAPNMPGFFRTFGKQGAVITAVDVVRGLACAVGLKVIDVPGATGWIDTNYGGKARYALDALKAGLDFVYIHVEATDECGHAGAIDKKIQAIQDIDSNIVGPLIEGMQKIDDVRLAIAPDHKTPVILKAHDPGPVPFLLYDSTESKTNTVPFDERAIDEAKTHVEDGTELIRMLFAK
jgi:2,3-bisphosphoglycerate-independent phosphoglycerate mutase